MIVNQGNFLFVISKIRQRLFSFLETEMAADNITDISPSYGDILFVLDQKGSLTVQEIANYTLKDKSTVSSVITRLEERGYVSKVKVSGDGRYTRIRLTPRAKKLKKHLWKISSEMNARLFEGLNEEEKKQLFELISKIYRNI